MTKLLLILGLTTVLPYIVLTADPKCHTSEIMQCLDVGVEWLKTLPKRSIPETEEQVSTMCTEVNKALDCAHRFIDSCLTPMQKEVVSLAVEGISDFRVEFCAPESTSRPKYMKHATCLNKVAQTDEVKDAMEYIIAVVEKLRDIDDKQKISYACCGYAKGYNIFLTMGKQNCGDEAVEAAKELAGLILAQLPDVLCNGFTGSEDRCTAVLPPEGSKPTDSIKGTAIYEYARNALANWLD